MAFQKMTDYFQSTDGRTIIAYHIYEPIDIEPIAVLQISHGMCEYISRYEDFASYLCGKGFVVCGNDHLGHGLSAKADEDYGYFGEKDGYLNLVGDLYKLTELMKHHFPNLPYYLLGHSMGSFLARSYLTSYGTQIDGAIIMGTSGGQFGMKLGVRIADLIAKQKGSRKRSKLLDSIAFSAYNKRIPNARTKFDWLSANPDNVDAYIADPMCGENSTVGLFRDMLGGIGFITDRRNIGKMDMTTPVFFIAGDQDPVGDMGKGVTKAYEAFQKAGVKDVSMKLYHGLRHEILNEKTRKFVYQDVLDWLNARI